MTERTGLDSVSVAVLESLDALGARPDSKMKKSARIVDHLYEMHGIPPRIGYDAICTLVAPWLMNIPLVAFNGNMGGPDEDNRAAARNYTEVRLSPVGAMALASERGELPRLPIGLSNGDLAWFGSSPPFDPARVVDALRLAAMDGTDDELIAAVGPPSFPTGCPVECDFSFAYGPPAAPTEHRTVGAFSELVAGRSTMLKVSSEIAVETDGRGTRLVITRVPFGVGHSDLALGIATRLDFLRRGRFAAMYPELQEALDLPVREVHDETDREGIRIVCNLVDGADVESCRKRLLEMNPVVETISVHLRAPLATLVRRFVDEPTAQNEAMTTLLSHLHYELLARCHPSMR